MNTESFEPYITARVGEEAPDFTSDAYYKDDFIKVSLSDYLGKYVLLVFYPADFTGVCNSELVQLNEKVNEFDAINTQILSCSTDTMFAHKAFCENIGKMSFPMLADSSQDIACDYDVLLESGLSLRATIIIDDKGVIQSQTVNNLPIGRSVDEMLRTIKAAQTGEMCPVGWQEGDETLGK